MRILLVSASLPGNAAQSSHGIFRRLDMFVDALKRVASEIDALFYVQPDTDISEDNTAQIQAILEARWGVKMGLTLCHCTTQPERKDFWGMYVHPSLGFHNIPEYAQTSNAEQVLALESCLDRAPDFIFVHRLRCMPPLLLTKKKLPAFFFDLDDIEHVSFLRGILSPPHWLGKYLLGLRLPALLVGERHAIRAAKRTYVCSEIDKKKLESLFGGASVEAVPNAVQLPAYSLTPTKPTLLILGQYAYPPNKIGAEFFLDQVWMRVLEAVPEAECLIAGANSDKIRQFPSPPPGVKFMGFVDNLDGLYDSARVVVCPILSGGGTRLKIIEAAAYGKPIVSTTIGAEGLALKNDEHLLIRDDPKRIAEACVLLLRDTAEAQRLGLAARATIIQRYDYAMIVEKIKSSFLGQ